MEAYQLTRSRRKSLSLAIGKDGSLLVKAPNWLPKYQIEEFIRQKSDWIQARRLEIYQIQQQKAAHTFQEGDCFLFLGETYCLKLHFSEQGEEETVVQNQQDNILFAAAESMERSHVKRMIEAWYLAQAREIFSERTAHYYPLAAQAAEAAGEKIDGVNRITVRNQKTRWGSCSSKGNLNFNWRLLQAPKEILDYVVVHELCHLVYMNHSRQFWNLVETVLPGAMEYRSWLRKNSALLDWEEDVP